MIIIVEGNSTIINPPLYGEYLIEVLNVKYRSKAEYNKSDETVHICIDGLERLRAVMELTNQLSLQY